MLGTARGSRPGPRPDPYNRETQPRTAGDHSGHTCNCRRHAKAKLLIYRDLGRKVDAAEV
jgi:hypothetical protein